MKLWKKFDVLFQQMIQISLEPIFQNENLTGNDEKKPLNQYK